MAKRTSNDLAIEAIKDKFGRSNEHLATTKKQVFGIEILQIKFNDESEQKSRYVALLKGKAEVFTNISDFIDFINSNSEGLGLSKGSIGQFIFDNTANVLALMITMAFVFLLIIKQDSTLIEILKYVLGLIFGFFFATQNKKKEKV